MLAAVSSSKWEQPIIKPKYDNENDDDEELILEQNRACSFLEDQASSFGKLNRIILIRL